MNEFYTVLTQVGLDKDAAARAGGPPIALATIHAGDGGGPDYYDQYDRDDDHAVHELPQKSFAVSQPCTRSRRVVRPS